MIRYELTLDVREDTQAQMVLSAIAPEYVLDKGRAKVRLP